jgi:hypothetical protein
MNRFKNSELAVRASQQALNAAAQTDLAHSRNIGLRLLYCALPVLAPVPCKGDALD